MKKNYLVEGIAFTLLGIALLLIAVFTESIIDGLIWGFTGAALASGIGIIIKYYYWASPKRAQRYQELQEQEEINLHDELNEKLRNKSCRIAYTIGFYIVCISMVMFSLLGKAGIIVDHRIIVLYLFGLLVCQVIIRIVAYNCLKRKY